MGRMAHPDLDELRRLDSAHLIARALWETVALAPPLCTTQEEADHMADTLVDSLREIG
jgi:adenosylmethionine-8-amino-7-oxononanoate aminotransferase